MKNYKIAVLSDIHSNYTAFKACLEDLKKYSINHVLFLGDYVSDYPEPLKTMNLLYEVCKNYPTTLIRGNREDYLANPSSSWQPSSKNGSIYYTYHQLRKKDLEFLNALPKTKVFQLENTDPILMVHGSPKSSTEPLLKGEEKTFEYLNKIEQKVLLAGHTHIPYIDYYNNKMIVNVGSVGTNVIGDNTLQYAILSWKNDHWVPSLQKITYDYKKEQERIVQSDFPSYAFYWAAAAYKNLETGENEILKLLNKALEFSNGKRPSEDDFSKAAKELNIKSLI